MLAVPVSFASAACKRQDPLAGYMVAGHALTELAHSLQLRLPVGGSVVVACISW